MYRIAPKGPKALRARPRVPFCFCRFRKKRIVFLFFRSHLSVSPPRLSSLRATWSKKRNSTQEGGSARAASSRRAVYEFRSVRTCGPTARPAPRVLGRVTHVCAHAGIAQSKDGVVARQLIGAWGAHTGRCHHPPLRPGAKPAAQHAPAVKVSMHTHRTRTAVEHPLPHTRLGMHHTTHTLSRTPHTLYTQGKTRAVEPASRRIMHEVWNAHGWQVRYGAMAALDNICLRPSDARHGWGRLNAPIARVGARTPTWACSTLFVTTLRGGATSIQACARRAAASSDYLYTVKPRACAATIGVEKMPRRSRLPRSA